MKTGGILILSSTLLSGCAYMESAAIHLNLDQKKPEVQAQKETQAPQKVVKKTNQPALEKSKTVTKLESDKTVIKPQAVESNRRSVAPAEAAEYKALVMPQEDEAEINSKEDTASVRLENNGIELTREEGEESMLETSTQETEIDEDLVNIENTSESAKKSIPVTSAQVTEIDENLVKSEELSTIPGPSTQKITRLQEPARQVSDAQIYIMENKWFNEKLWLYNDGAYAQRDPQRICGQWKKQDALLILMPKQGGRQLYSPRGRGGWQAEAGGLSVLRPEQK
jgi:hypothetical protein